MTQIKEESGLSPAPAPLKELIAKWRADRIALNLAASTMAHEASKFAWEGQAVGRMDCANELEAAVSALSPQPPNEVCLCAAILMPDGYIVTGT